MPSGSGDLIALQAMTDAELCARVPALEPGHARKLLADVHRRRSIEPRPGLPRRAIDAVLAAGGEPSLQVVRRQASQIDPFVKYLFEAPDGQRFEAVRIPLDQPDRFSVCVSSQVGCALACAFCATGRLGLRRNLQTWEIVEQVRAIAAELPPAARIHGIVFQGMGEPLANIDRVAAAIEVFRAPYTMAIDTRNITVCTAGLPEGIRKLARLAPRARLGWSIGSALAETRRQLMPITNAHSLADVLAAVIDHARVTRLSPMWAVTLLDGVNDGDQHARALVDLALRFVDATGRTPHISVIAYNAIGDGDPFRRAREERVAGFRGILDAAGLPSHRRYSGGGDIAAACGQLVAL